MKPCATRPAYRRVPTSSSTPCGITLAAKPTNFSRCAIPAKRWFWKRTARRRRFPLHAQLTGTDVPQEIMFAAYTDIIIVVPDTPARVYSWFGLSSGVEGYIAFAEDTLKAAFPPADGAERSPLLLRDGRIRHHRYDARRHQLNHAVSVRICRHAFTHRSDQRDLRDLRKRAAARP